VSSFEGIRGSEDMPPRKINQSRQAALDLWAHTGGGGRYETPTKRKKSADQSGGGWRWMIMTGHLPLEKACVQGTGGLGMDGKTGTDDNVRVLHFGKRGGV